MLKQKDIGNPADVISLEQKRAFLKLTLAERRSLLSQQAEDALRHYETDEGTAEREAWQGGDIVEY